MGGVGREWIGSGRSGEWRSEWEGSGRAGKGVGGVAGSGRGLGGVGREWDGSGIENELGIGGVETRGGHGRRRKTKRIGVNLTLDFRDKEERNTMK